jgi:prophage antirepressor-like protein
MLSLTLDYNGAPVRMIGEVDRPEWIAADVCRVLGIKLAHRALADFDADERGRQIVTTLGGPQTVATVTEAGVYRLALRSRKPEAKAFRRWLLHDVLPSIRRHGCYPPPATVAADDILATGDIAALADRGLFGPVLERATLPPDYRLDAATGRRSRGSAPAT